MKLLIARIFRLIFKIKYFGKYYFGIYKKIIVPYHLLDNKVIISSYDKNLKIKLELDEWIQQQIFFFGYFDERGIKFLKNQLKPGDVFFDIGANIGSYSLIASKLVGDKGYVYSFEPVVYDNLTGNISLNGIQNIIAEKKAVYEKNDILKFYVSGKSNKGMSSIFRHDTESGIIESVPAVSLDYYVEKAGIKKINLIKIDIEGAELFALKGMRKILKEFRPLILIEVSDEVLENSTVKKNDIIEFIEGFGYQRKTIDINGMISEMNQSFEEYTNYTFIPV